MRRARPHVRLPPLVPSSRSPYTCRRARGTRQRDDGTITEGDCKRVNNPACYDPIVLARQRAAYRRGRETAYLGADIRNTGAMPETAARTLDFSQPVGLMMVAVLHCIPDEDDPWSLVRDLVAALPSGSYLALTHPGNDFHPERTDVVVARLNQMMPQKITFRAREQVRRFFEGLEWVEPGLVRAPEWRPDSAADAANPAKMWSGVARKP